MLKIGEYILEIPLLYKFDQINSSTINGSIYIYTIKKNQIILNWNRVYNYYLTELILLFFFLVL